MLFCRRRPLLARNSRDSTRGAPRARASACSHPRGASRAGGPQPRRADRASRGSCSLLFAETTATRRASLMCASHRKGTAFVLFPAFSVDDTLSRRAPVESHCQHARRARLGNVRVCFSSQNAERPESDFKLSEFFFFGSTLGIARGPFFLARLCRPPNPPSCLNLEAVAP